MGSDRHACHREQSAGLPPTCRTTFFRGTLSVEVCAYLPSMQTCNSETVSTSRLRRVRTLHVVLAPAPARLWIRQPEHGCRVPRGWRLARRLGTADWQFRGRIEGVFDDLSHLESHKSKPRVPSCTPASNGNVRGIGAIRKARACRSGPSRRPTPRGSPRSGQLRRVGSVLAACRAAEPLDAARHGGSPWLNPRTWSRAPGRFRSMAVGRSPVGLRTLANRHIDF